MGILWFCNPPWLSLKRVNNTESNSDQTHQPFGVPVTRQLRALPRVGPQAWTYSSISYMLDCRTINKKRVKSKDLFTYDTNACLANWLAFCLDLIWLTSVLRPRQHSIGYRGDGFYRSKDPTNSIKVLKEQIVHRQIKHTISRHEHKTQQVR